MFRLIALAAVTAVDSNSHAQNIDGSLDDSNVTALACDDAPCLNNAACTNTVGYGVQGVNGNFTCDCPWGYFGDFCETGEYFTLQQWQSNECGGTPGGAAAPPGGTPWRCFRLQMGKCIDTLFTDGNFPNQKNWFGRLTHENTNGGLYTLDLCWGEGEEGEGEEGYDPEEKCNCEYHWANIRRLGKNSLGPPTGGDTQRDSDECHKLERITSSRLVNSTGMMTGVKEHTICGDPNAGNSTGAAHRQSSVFPAGLALIAAASFRQ